ncbi:hypothetical protein [uncultured Novosphingobium sp.]|uniref:hypothetical protein n=1 Tax=uncultured Novosphingobium sp. TaxID=292277 RepID=UPI003749F4E8
MTDVKVEQCDEDEAHYLVGKLAMDLGINLTGDAVRDLFYASFARHRQAAEKAQQERDAAYIEGKGGVIPGATVFVSLITGENMPCMSGDARDKLNPHKRRQFDDATRDLATAIRSQGHE